MDTHLVLEHILFIFFLRGGGGICSKHYIPITCPRYEITSFRNLDPSSTNLHGEKLKLILIKKMHVMSKKRRILNCLADFHDIPATTAHNKPYMLICNTKSHQITCIFLQNISKYSVNSTI